MAASRGQQRARSQSWARANLTAGSSGGQFWEISSEYPEARLTLGSDPSAGWPIAAPGVKPVHCELFWDGQALWVSDTHRAGGVFLDGQRIGDWRQIHGPAQLRFGQAAMDIETSAPINQMMSSDPSNARPVTVTDLVMPPDDRRRSDPPFSLGPSSGEQLTPCGGETA